ncbi:PEP-CTERM sorting domain-containing protein [Paludisphaera borealis]|uniref:PEP-CTERM sorting domain-containing protein n=1 Tax=Paludisphaera borealis TaxID=1387353 RepID=UPI0011AB3A8D|nr:PEP-CTERM sorting domain-containing protein [Paludisphaera borealis]
MINAGDSFNGLTYSAFTAGPSGTLLGGDITSLYNSFSGLSLGGRQSGGAQFFFGGDSFTVTFATPVNAFGIFFNVNPNSGNYGISTSVGNAVTGSASYDTSTFVFAGLISTTSFSSATIYSTDARLGSYNIPEIVTASAPAVPEPSALVMGLLGMVSMGGAVLRSRRVVR